MTIAAPTASARSPAEDFFLGVYMTAVGPGELLTKIRVPAAGGARRLRRGHDRRDGTCIVSAAATLDGDRTARVAIGCVDAVPVLVRPREPTRTRAERGRRAAPALDPPSDVHAPADYRRHLAEVLRRPRSSQAESEEGSRRPEPRERAPTSRVEVNGERYEREVEARRCSSTSSATTST